MYFIKYITCILYFKTAIVIQYNVTTEDANATLVETKLTLVDLEISKSEIGQRKQRPGSTYVEYIYEKYRNDVYYFSIYTYQLYYKRFLNLYIHSM